MLADPTHAFAFNDIESWNSECMFIEKLLNFHHQKPNRATNIQAFIGYCEKQRDLAANRGFNSARVRIQQSINYLKLIR